MQKGLVANFNVQRRTINANCEEELLLTSRGASIAPERCWEASHANQEQRKDRILVQKRASICRPTSVDLCAGPSAVQRREIGITFHPTQKPGPAIKLAGKKTRRRQQQRVGGTRTSNPPDGTTCLAVS